MLRTLRAQKMEAAAILACSTPANMASCKENQELNSSSSQCLKIFLKTSHSVLLQNWASFGNSQLLNVPTLANQNTTKIQKEEFQTL